MRTERGEEENEEEKERAILRYRQLTASLAPTVALLLLRFHDP